MGVTVGANMLSVVHKSSSGVSMAFPDVCKAPSPAGPTPIPYPNVAKTALKDQAKGSKKVKGTGNLPTTKSAKYSMSQGTETGVTKGTISSAARGEINQLKAILNRLNTNLLKLRSHNPDEWQRLLQDYLVAAGALYVTREMG